jgi:oxysterol-binding protein-related protein 9/10/11
VERKAWCPSKHSFASLSRTSPTPFKILISPSIQAQGYTRQTITFNGSVHVKQIGHAVLHLDAYNEDYAQTLPAVTIKSLLTGCPYPELSGPVHIYSSSGYTSKIEFSGISMLGIGGDKKNTVRAKLYKTSDDNKTPLYEVEGQWSDTFLFRDARQQNLDPVDAFDTHTSKPTPLTVAAPLSSQDPWESRRAWHKVATAIRAGDMQGTSAAKSVIEKAQREMRKREKAEGRQWDPKFFTRVDRAPLFDRLAAPHGELLQPEMTSGIWRFDEEKFRMARVPFHGELKPWGED